LRLKFIHVFEGIKINVPFTKVFQYPAFNSCETGCYKMQTAGISMNDIDRNARTP